MTHSAYYPQLTTAVAHEHQADLLREAAQRRLVTSTGSTSRAPEPRHRWWRRLLLPRTAALTVAGSPSRSA